MKRISLLGDNDDRPNSFPLSCALWIRDFIVKYNLGGNIFGIVVGNKVHSPINFKIMLHDTIVRVLYYISPSPMVAP